MLQHLIHLNCFYTTPWYAQFCCNHLLLGILISPITTFRKCPTKYIIHDYIFDYASRLKRCSLLLLTFMEEVLDIKFITQSFTQLIYRGQWPKWLDVGPLIKGSWLRTLARSPCLHSWAKCLISIASLHPGVYIGTCGGSA